MTEQSILQTIEPPSNLPVVKGKDDFRSVANVASKFLQEHMGMEKERVIQEMSFAVQIADKNPTLYQCSSASLYYALANLGNMGLSLNPAQKLAYLVPRKNRGQWECCLTPSYMGLIKTCTDAGGVLVIEAGLVFEGDDYEVQAGSGGYIKVTPLNLKPRSSMSPEDKEHLAARQRDFWGNLIFAYSKAILHNGAESIDFIDVERLKKIKKLCAKDKRDNSVWNVWPEEMAKKTVIAHHTKTLPKSERTALAVQSFHTAEGIDDYDNLPSHKKGSIQEQLLDERPDVECQDCGQVTVDGECHNDTCPSATPP